MASRWGTTGSRRSSRAGFRRPRASVRRRWTAPRWPPRATAAGSGAGIVAAPVARDWSDLLVTGAPDEAPRAGGEGEDTGRRRGILRRLRESMAKTRAALGSEIQATLFQTLDEHTWERLEE